MSRRRSEAADEVIAWLHADPLRTVPEAAARFGHTESKIRVWQHRRRLMAGAPLAKSTSPKIATVRKPKRRGAVLQTIKPKAARRPPQPEHEKRTHDEDVAGSDAEELDPESADLDPEEDDESATEPATSDKQTDDPTRDEEHRNVPPSRRGRPRSGGEQKVVHLSSHSTPRTPSPPPLPANPDVKLRSALRVAILRRLAWLGTEGSLTSPDQRAVASALASVVACKDAILDLGASEPTPVADDLDLSTPEGEAQLVERLAKMPPHLLSAASERQRTG